MTAIANSTSLCMRSFSRLTAALATGEQDHRESMSPGKIEAEFGRFKIWSGNLGALQSGRSSLDFRLRESTVMQTNLMKLLTKLDLTLQKSIQVANGTRLPLEKLPKPEYLSEESSEDESETGNEDELIATELSQHMLTIMDILADLYKLSFRIRNAATKTKSLKPALYKEIDEETNIDKFAEYANYDHSHVLESFKQLQKDAAEQMSSILPENPKDEQEEMYLAERLAITITKRRRALRYWQRHAKKLADAPGVPQSYSVSMNVVAASNTGQLPQRLQPARHIAALSLMENSILSGTEATTYDRKLDNSLDTQSVISYASTAFDLYGNSICLPPPPVAASRGAEFLCPYCGIICPSRHGKNRAWRAHVLQDLQPYICTYPDCSDAFQMYSSRHLWLEHERLVHRRIWQCFGHANAVFASSSELRDHLQSQHSESVTEAQIQNLLDVCESSVVDTRTKCPICLIGGPFKKGLDNHLSFHLETFANFSVPRSIFSGGESESGVDGNSESAQGLRSDISTKSISLSFQSPPASTSSSANKEPKEETRPEQEASTAQDNENPAPHSVGSGPDLTLKDHSDLEGKFNNLGSNLQRRYERRGSIEDLEGAIRVARQAVDITPKDHPDLAGRLNNLGNKLESRCVHTGKMDDLEEAIQVARQAVDVTPEDHPDLAGMLNNLGNKLKLRYKRTGKMDDLKEAIQVARQAVDVTPEGHPFIAAWLDNLGNKLESRHERTGKTDDLKEALQVARQAVNFTPKDPLDLAVMLNNLGNKLESRYECTGKIEDLEEAMQVARRAVDLTPEGHPYLATWLDNLGNKLGHRYKLIGRIEDLEEALRVSRRAVSVTPEDHPDLAWRLNNLGNKLESRYEHMEKMDDLEEALRVARQAVNITPEDHPDLAGRLNNLGNKLESLYKRTGKIEDLEEAIRVARQAVDATPEDHPDLAGRLNDLGDKLLYAGQEMLEEAGEVYQRALKGREKALGPEHTSTLDTVNNLGNLCVVQGRLDEAEQMYQRALKGREKALGPEHTLTLNTVNNLSNLYMDQGRLDEAKQMYQRVLEGREKALGPEHTLTLNTVNNLGNLYVDQGRLEEAEQMYQRALQGREKALGPEHPSALDTVNNLGNIYAGQARLGEAERMYQRALQGYEKALGHEQVNTYVPALNTTEKLAVLYKQMGRANEAEELYSRALYGLEAVLGRPSKRCQDIITALAVLHGDRE